MNQPYFASSFCSDHLGVMTIFSFNPSSVDDAGMNWDDFKLFQNYPNPFNPITSIRYDLPQVGSRASLFVNLKAYDLLGNKIAELVNEEKAPGSYEIIFDASKLSSGVYIYKLKTLGYLRYRKMIVLK